MSCGMANGWTSPVLPRITNTAAADPLAFADAAWLVVAYNVGMVLAAWPAALLMNK